MKIELIKKALADNTSREQIRVMLPNVIGKIEVNTVTGTYSIFNRSGKVVYISSVFGSQRNKSEVWRKSLKRATGNIILEANSVK